MSTKNQNITKQTGWNKVDDAVASGLFSVGSTAHFCTAESLPTEELTGHQLNSGESRRYTLAAGQFIYILANDSSDLIVIVDED